MMKSELEYYALPKALSDLSYFTDFTSWLSPDPRIIFQVVQGLIIHDMWSERYGIKISPQQKRAVCSLSAKDILIQSSKLRKRSISYALPRSPEEKVEACCREFSLLAAALFRAKGIPSRARCGFALYLAADGFYEDHWICEYWNGKEWIGIDPQIDPFQQSNFQRYATTEKNIGPEYKEMLLSFDPLHVSTKHFINAGVAWKMYRDGKIDAQKFGIGADPKVYNLKTLYGSWFIRGQVLRDFAALNKAEAVPFLVRLEFGQDWRQWRLAAASDEELRTEDFKLLDTLADLCANPEGRLSEIQKLFENNKELHPLL
jgi:hypothetical protein